MSDYSPEADRVVGHLLDFPSIGAVNPALTAIANSLRIGDHLLQRLGAARAGSEPASGG